MSEQAVITEGEPSPVVATEEQQAQEETKSDANIQESSETQDETVPVPTEEEAATEATNEQPVEQDDSEQVQETQAEQVDEQTLESGETEQETTTSTKPTGDGDEQVDSEQSSTEPPPPPPQEGNGEPASEPTEVEESDTIQQPDESSEQKQQPDSTIDKDIEQTSTEVAGGTEEQALPEGEENPEPSYGEGLGDSQQQRDEGSSEDQSEPFDQELGGFDTRPTSTLPIQPLEDIVEEEEEELVEVDRETLLAETKEALMEQERLQALNSQLQHKLAEYLARKKTEERADPGRTVTDQEKRYSKLMAALERHKMELEEIQQEFEYKVEEAKGDKEVKNYQVKQASIEFTEYRKERALVAVHSRTGKRLSSQEVDQYQAAEEKKEEELKKVRRENIKLQNKIAKQEAQIKQKEQLAEGLHMIDFEQLKINNVDLNEKIEERNEDILKLRKKVTSTVQVLTHVKEKLQFLQAENSEKRGTLDDMESLVAKKRDHLTRMKQVRDALRMDNIRLRQKGGLVGHSALLRDYEERRDQNEDLKDKLDQLQKRYSELTVTCDGLRKKIEQARTMTSHF